MGPPQITYCIAVPEPIAISIEDYDTGIVSTEELLKIIHNNFDLRPGMIIK